FESHSTQPVLFVEEGAIDDRADVAFGERIQNEHAHPREERAIQLEGWIFRSRTDERDSASLDMREKCVLLRFIEAVDLVHEQDRLPSQLQPLLGLNDY